ncbi:uncharacterized protein LOC121863759 isoform X2 [Homarus americanus]|uniref:uncharacterized protein LOC121863759 isoform X2 n=1 Tax=Homarus americanus TaxID=6706 RepID=UPI001C467F70|nr:uncharacterized protein LOC121863759 isoform X2 [Homarus americanus]
MDVVLKPCQEFALSLFLCPTAIEPLSGTLVCKFRGVVNLHKCKIPLQGYGGKSELMIPDSCDGKPLTVRELAPGLPAILQTAFLNKGDRAMFLKLQLFTDDQCSELLSLSDITIQPSEFILAPRENRDVFIVVNGTANILAKTPGCLGVLQVISGDEILRRRFRRLQNKEVKVRRINDPDLLKINWGVAYSREKEVQVEDDCLPPQPEDSVNFFNSCSKIQVQLYGERQTNDDASSTVFACLETEDTIGSMADITAANDKITEVHSPPVQGSVFHLPHKSQPAANIETGRTITWDVFPQTLSVPASDMSTLVFFVVNFSEVQQMFEVSSDCRWLDIEPREAILLSLSSVKVCVKLSPSRMPQSIVAPLTQSLKIMCENESRCAKITVLPTGGGDEDLQPQAVPSLQSQAAPHPPTLPKSTTGNLFHMKEASTDPQGHEIKALAVKYNSMPTASKTSQKVSGDSDLNLMDSAKSLVEVVSDNVIFPNTSTMKENYVKVKLRNLDGVIHTVKAEISQGPFTVRHTQFRIKSGHYVSVPVYFRPQTTGLFSCHLKLTVLEDKKVLTVQLSGRAVH